MPNLLSTSSSPIADGTIQDASLPNRSPLCPGQKKQRRDRGKELLGIGRALLGRFFMCLPSPPRVNMRRTQDEQIESALLHSADRNRATRYLANWPVAVIRSKRHCQYPLDLSAGWGQSDPVATSLSRGTARTSQSNQGRRRQCFHT